MLTVAEGLIPGVFMSASYDKYLLRQFFRDMVDPEGAVIGAEIGVKTGPASISLVYSLRYVDDPALPADERWEKSAGIQSSLSFF